MPVKDITMANIFISAYKGFEAIYATDFILKNIKIIPKQGGVYSFDRSKNIFIENGYCPKGVNVFMKVMGKDTENIRLVNTDLSCARVPVEYESNSNKNVVKWK